MTALREATKQRASLAPLQALVKDDLTRVNQVLVGSIAEEIPLIANVASHIIASGGKRLRPTLTLAAAQLCGYSGERHVHLAATVELLHTATLLHDDVVDESTLRRGEETANVIWSNQTSVLVGDFMLSRAFQLMVEDGNIEVLRILANASATISRGEVMQLETANDPATSIERYLAVVEAKTSALFAAACELGAVITGKKESQAPLRQCGILLGMAFQLVDDALDYSAKQQELGKTIGDDFREGKITLPVILSYAQGTKEERAFWHRTLEDMEKQESDLATAIAIIAKYNTITETLARARTFADDAQAVLRKHFPASPMRLALEEMLDFCVERAF